MNISISPSTINEGDTSVIKCTVQRTPPGIFSWMLGGKQAGNGERIGIETKYEAADKRHLSTLTLEETDLLDIGEYKRNKPLLSDTVESSFYKLITIEMRSKSPEAVGEVFLIKRFKTSFKFMQFCFVLQAKWNKNLNIRNKMQKT